MKTRFFSILLTLLFQLASIAQDYDAELVKQETSITVVNDKLTKTEYFEIKINNRGGEKYTKVRIPFSSLEKLSKVEAYILDADGREVRKLKKSEITTRSAISNFSLYEDDFIMEFTLKHNSYPYSIVYSYQYQQNEFLYVDYWLPVIDNRVPTGHARLSISIPQGFAISYSNSNIEEPEIVLNEEIVAYTWQTSYSQIINSETLSPPLINFLPSVAIVPLKFNFELKGSFESWSDYGKWQFELLKDLKEFSINEKSTIQTLIRDVDNEKEKIRVLYHYLQDATRYINVSIETGGMKPYPASYVAENKYGDCKALTNYFKSVLDYAGIQSFYTKVNAGEPIDEIDKSFPSQQFNHVVLFVPLKEDSVWLDCTSDGPFNYLGTFTQNREALVVGEDSSYFLHTPELNDSDVLDSRKISIAYNANQSSTVIFQNIYRGEMFETLTEIKQSFNESEKTRILRNYIMEKGFELIDYTISQNNRDSLQIMLTCETKSNEIYKHFGNDVLVNNIPFSLPVFEKPGNRKLPLQIDYPIHKSDTLIYAIVPGYELSKNFVNQKVASKYGNYSIAFSFNEESVQVVKSILIKPGFYPISEYAEFYKFYNEIKELENMTCITFFK
ncbi:MAG TPA: DUF3857 domain-containing protein [Bacteroidales bacterium]